MLSDEKTLPDLRIQQIEQGGANLQEEILIEQAIHDPASFAILYRRYASRVYRYAFSRVHNHAEAEDLTAQVFMAVLEQLHTFGRNGNFKAWLFTIARNKVMDLYRMQRNLVSLETVADLPAPEDDPDSRVEQNEDFYTLRGLIEDLPNEQQEMLRLRFAAQLRYAEIGTVIGKTEAAVKMSCRRLLRRMQEKMEARDE